MKREQGINHKTNN